MNDLSSLISRRAETHGDFAEVAEFAQTYRELFRSHPGWVRLTPIMREAIDMTASKYARIMCGDPLYEDHWTDLQGYPALVHQRLP